MTKKINSKDYESWSKDELIKEIIKIRSTTYGLVWHRDLPEEKIDILVNPDARTPNEMFPNEMAGKPFPVLDEVKAKAIKTDDNKLVNLLIEGDNYHSLAVLNFTHREAVDIIYIDPPYNTGNKDFIYNDEYVEKEDSFRHSKWLSFIEKRLKLAKNLLKPEGVIFISIDDHEYAPLKLLCDEIFGEKNFVGSLIWEKKKKGSHLDSSIINIKEYILVYSRNSEYFSGLISQSVSTKETYPCINPGNTVSVRTIPLGIKSNFSKNDHLLSKGTIITDGTMKMVLHSDLVIKNGYLEKDLVIEGEWRYSQDLMSKMAKSGELYLTTKLYLRRIVTDPREKRLKDILLRVDRDYLIEKKNELINEYEKNPNDIEEIKVLKKIICDLENIGADYIDPDNLNSNGWGSNEDGDDEQRSFFGKKVFDYPKPSKLIAKLLLSTRMKDALVLDFMAGTGTTGHAVLRCNEIDRGNRKFILCTNNGDEKSNHKIASDICYPRLKKAIKGFEDVHGKEVKGLGGNLKYFVTDFVEAEPTDKNKRKLVKESTEMLCIKENAYELVEKSSDFVIFKNTDKYIGVIYYEEAIDDYKKSIKNINGHFNTYVFSLGDDPHEKKFSDVKEKVTLCAIPEVILKVYREIFK